MLYKVYDVFRKFYWLFNKVYDALRKSYWNFRKHWCSSFWQLIMKSFAGICKFYWLLNKVYDAFHRFYWSFREPYWNIHNRFTYIFSVWKINRLYEKHCNIYRNHLHYWNIFDSAGSKVHWHSHCAVSRVGFPFNRDIF